MNQVNVNSYLMPDSIRYGIDTPDRDSYYWHPITQEVYSGPWLITYADSTPLGIMRGDILRVIGYNGHSVEGSRAWNRENPL